MKIRQTLAAIGLGAVLALTGAACTSGPVQGAVQPVQAPTATSPTPPPVPVALDAEPDGTLTVETVREMSTSAWEASVCTNFIARNHENNVALQQGAIRNDDTLQDSAFTRYMDALRKGCPDEASPVLAQFDELRGTGSPSAVTPTPGPTSGDEQHAWGCEQGYITEGC